MNGVMNENVIVKVYEVYKPLIQKIESIIDDCRIKPFHTFDQIGEYYLNFTNIGNNETVNVTNSVKSMASYKLNNN